MPRTKKTTSDTGELQKAVKPVARRVKKTQDSKETGLQIPVYNTKGEVEKNISLSREIFSAPVNTQLLSQYVRVYLANQRQGTAATKTRSEVAGSTKKIYRQKGTGRARHGAKKAPIFVGGGITFGPQPRDYSLKMSKKQKRKALLGSLSLKVQANAVIGLSNTFTTIEPKTKVVASSLEKMGFGKKKLLLVLSEVRNNLALASRNLSNVDTIPVSNMNPYLITKHDVVLFTEEAIEKVTSTYSKPV